MEKNPTKKKLSKSCCSKSSAQGRAGASKLRVSPAHARKENNPPPITKKPAQDAMNKKRVTPKSLHMKDNCYRSISVAGSASSGDTWIRLWSCCLRLNLKRKFCSFTATEGISQCSEFIEIRIRIRIRIRVRVVKI